MQKHHPVKQDGTLYPGEPNWISSKNLEIESKSQMKVHRPMDNS